MWRPSRFLDCRLAIPDRFPFFSVPLRWRLLGNYFKASLFGRQRGLCWAQAGMSLIINRLTVSAALYIAELAPKGTVGAEQRSALWGEAVARQAPGEREQHWSGRVLTKQSGGVIENKGLVPKTKLKQS